MVKELGDKQSELTQLNDQIRQKTEERAKLAEKPSSAASGAAQSQSAATNQNKLDYFEGEVRRLESQLTQQKVSYEKKLRELEKQIKEAA